MSRLANLTMNKNLKTASELMRRKLVTLAPEDDLFTAVGRLLRDNISGAPVVGDDGTYLGVFSEKCSITALTTTVEVASEVGLHVVHAHEIMTRKLTTLSGKECVFDAIDHLLSRRISGAPVVDERGRFQGVFSEKTAMRVLSAALHDGLPGTNVESYMNLDRNRIIHEGVLLLDVARLFQSTPYRRLPVLREERLVGQVSRRDVLRGEYRLAAEVMAKANSPHVSQRLKAAVAPKTVGDHMDTLALTASPGMDLLGIAQLFLNSPYRRLPILDGTRLVGQISRRDLLQAAAEKMRPIKKAGKPETLYLSGVHEALPPALS